MGEALAALAEASAVSRWRYAYLRQCDPVGVCEVNSCGKVDAVISPARSRDQQKLFSEPNLLNAIAFRNHSTSRLQSSTFSAAFTGLEKILSREDYHSRKPRCCMPNARPESPCPQVGHPRNYIPHRVYRVCIRLLLQEPCRSWHDTLWLEYGRV